ncbi:ribose 5-phosphate isomerase B [Thermoproteota archaeon]
MINIPTNIRMAIGSDHGGFALKSAVVEYLKEKYPDIQILDLGTSSVAPVDYPEFAEAVAKNILDDKADLGLLFCGAGIGVSITANRFKGIRAALVHDVFTARLAKQHNNANILCMGGRNTDLNSAILLIETWLTTEFEGERHLRRINKIDR